MTFQESEQQKWEADEYYCAVQFLNKLKVPSQDENGNTYSIVGRIVSLMKMCETERYEEQKLSDKDFADFIISKVQTPNI